ncbi:hypothetical protein [Geodermatophilus sabuli]|nr:hypothetical protein [Geodermatophilus sabuli]
MDRLIDVLQGWSVAALVAGGVVVLAVAAHAWLRERSPDVEG